MSSTLGLERLAAAAFGPDHGSLARGCSLNLTSAYYRATTAPARQRNQQPATGHPAKHA
jgi:hypothetical protein